MAVRSASARPKSPDVLSSAVSRKTGLKTDSTQKAIRDTAVAMISEHGYHAVTLRALADRIGIQAGSLYNHIENKQDLLFLILRDIMSDLIGEYEKKASGVEDPSRRLDIFIDNHVSFHTSRKEEVFIGNMELRNLEPDNYVKLVKLRDTYQAHLTGILKDGVAAKVFAVDDLRIATFAIFGMLNSVASWFDPTGPRSKRQITTQFQRIIGAIVRSGK